jgi:hypothetical protein
MYRIRPLPRQRSYHDIHKRVFASPAPENVQSSAQRGDNPEPPRALLETEGTERVIDLSSDHEDDANFTLLHLAAINGHSRCIELLLDKGADIDALNGHLRETALIIAAIYSPKCGELLIRRAARVDLCDWHGTTALKWELF